MTDRIIIPFTIDIHAYLRDHNFLGTAVLPAVESMGWMASSVRSLRPKADPRLLTNAKFKKFLYIEPKNTKIEAFNEIEIMDDGLIIVRLMTKNQSPQSPFKRSMEHAAICFNDNPYQNKEPAEAFEFTTPEKDAICVSAERIYRELVPFGPSYHNLTGEMKLFETGADAIIHAPDYPTPQSPLGSPFPLDAAFHAACVWGQRYTDIVGFPVGFDKRRILQPTKPGDTYRCRIVPIKTTPEKIKFNILIYKEKKELFESIVGVEMRDVSAGRMVPPDWIKL